MKGMVDWQEGDLEVLAEYKASVRQLVALVEEVFVTEPRNLLSPVLREIVVDSAHRLGRRHENIDLMLTVDNPGRSLRIRENG